MSQSTGLVLPVTCRTWACEWCGPRRAYRLSTALDHAGYSRWVTLTAAPEDIRGGVRRLLHAIRREVAWEWAWSAETGPATGMRHVHAVVRGPYLPQKRLSELADGQGWGLVAHIAQASQAAAYSAKQARYSGKEAWSGYEAWRELNGGSRPWHWSRGYTDGVPMRDWVREHAPSTDRGPWIRVLRELDPAEPTS